MSELKCPVCGKQMKIGTLDQDDSMGTVWMSIMPCDCVCSYGASKAVWQELIRTRENLQKANAELDYIKEQVEKSNAFIHARIKVAAEQIARGIIDQVKIIKEQKDVK